MSRSPPNAAAASSGGGGRPGHAGQEGCSQPQADHEAIARARLWQCPTVINSVGTAADFTGDPGLAFWLKANVESWRKTALERLTGISVF